MSLTILADDCCFAQSLPLPKRQSKGKGAHGRRRSRVKNSKSQKVKIWISTWFVLHGARRGWSAFVGLLDLGCAKQSNAKGKELTTEGGAESKTQKVKKSEFGTLHPFRQMKRGRGHVPGKVSRGCAWAVPCDPFSAQWTHRPRRCPERPGV